MKVEVIYKKESIVPNCWVYNRYFDARIITWIDKREFIVKKWSWKHFGFTIESKYKYYLHQNNPKITTTTYDGEYSTNSIIDSNMTTEKERALIWFAENVGDVDIEM